MKVVPLELALRDWATQAGLENGIATAKNPKWTLQAHELLLKSEWARIRPLLQKIVDDNQELLQRLNHG